MKKMKKMKKINKIRDGSEKRFAIWLCLSLSLY